ncbi:MAG: zinc-ribbon domain-containing protein [Promethearchaeota archaeon]
MQNQLDRKFCPRCQRNVFAVRPKINVIAVAIGLFIFFLPGIIYFIYYGMKKKDRCPICYSKVGPIDYNYPPFRGTPESFDPSLIYVGKVVRTEPTMDDPEGDFVSIIPDNNINISSNLQQQPNINVIPAQTGPSNIPYQFCQFCGAKINQKVKFCPQCGQKLPLSEQ